MLVLKREFFDIFIILRWKWILQPLKEPFVAMSLRVFNPLSSVSSRVRILHDVCAFNRAQKTSYSRFMCCQDLHIRVWNDNVRFCQSIALLDMFTIISYNAGEDNVSSKRVVQFSCVRQAETLWWGAHNYVPAKWSFILICGWNAGAYRDV